MKEIILQGVVFILLVGYIFLIRFFKKNESNQRTSARLIDSMKLKCEELKLQIEQQNKEIASLLTENEQLKEALRGGGRICHWEEQQRNSITKRRNLAIAKSI